MTAFEEASRSVPGKVPYNRASNFLLEGYGVEFPFCSSEARAERHASDWQTPSGQLHGRAAQLGAAAA